MCLCCDGFLAHTVFWMAARGATVADELGEPTPEHDGPEPFRCRLIRHCRALLEKGQKRKNRHVTSRGCVAFNSDGSSDARP